MKNVNIDIGRVAIEAPQTARLQAGRLAGQTETALHKALQAQSLPDRLGDARIRQLAVELPHGAGQRQIAAALAEAIGNGIRRGSMPRQ